MDQNYNFSYVTPPTTLAAGERRDISLVTDNDSFFVVEKMVAVYDYSFKTLIRDTAKNLGWSNIPIRSENLFGTAQFPTKMMTPIILSPSTTVTFDLQSLELVNPNGIQIALEGYRVYEPVKEGNKRFYIYAADFALPANNILDNTVQISNLGDFTVEKLVRYADGQAQARISASGLAGRNLVSGLIRLDNLFGNALNPNYVKHPYTLEKNSILQIYAQNLEAAVNNVQLCFEGNIKLGGETSPEVI